MTARDRQIQAYANLILKGSITIEAVPSGLRADVEKKLNETKGE